MGMNNTNNTAAKTIDQIIADEQAARTEWESKKVVAKIGNQEITIAELRKTFDAICAADWKQPCAAFVPHQIVGIACKAIEWFHGAKAEIGGIQPLTGKVLVSSPGYAG